MWHWSRSTTSCMVQAESGEDIKTRCTGSKKNLLNRTDWSSIKQDRVLSNKIERNHPLRLTPSLLYPESCYDGIWRNHIREIIGWKNCILKLLEVVKTPNKSKQNQETNYQERWDLLVSNHLVCLLRRSEKMYCLAANAQTQERWDLWVDNQPVCSISSRKERHWLQGVWIATCSCETSRKLPCSRAREEGRESSSSRSTSSRLAAR